MSFDIVIKNGLYFDGSGAAGVPRHLGIRDGRITAVSVEALDETGARVFDASGRWVTPGFLEPHSHYDAEVIAAPALKESVRHGITTVAIGSCSLSMINSGPQDSSDLFTRVEAIPRAQVIPLLHEKKTWNNARDYRAFYDQHPLGPNLCSFVGHSDLRVAVMGMDRATQRIEPTPSELRQMEDQLNEALDAGMLGLSVMTTRFDRVDGDVAWSRPLPSTFARWSEFGRLFGILRRRGGVLQGAPDAAGKINMAGFLWHAMGWFRTRLKTSLLTAMDMKSQPWLHVLTRYSGWMAQKFLRADFRWQMLPVPMRLYCDGLDWVMFEEFTGGKMLRHLKSKDDQYEKIKDPVFRALFKRDLKRAIGAGLWNRDFGDADVVDCPDQSLIGKNFVEIGQAQGKDGVDAYFDLCILYREKLRWTTLTANQRPEIMHKFLKSQSTQVGFADSGAHLRALAFYNFPLRTLKYVRDAALAGKPFMDTGAAVHRLTGELADWFGLDAGYIRVGDRADVVIVNPEGLTDELDRVAEAEAEGLGLVRLVNRNDAAVDATLINGRIAYERGQGYAADLGQSRGYGRFLPGKHLRARQSAAVPALTLSPS
ncbi:MAG TPA: amidohydrolase family protein [Solimonas sp.]|nr:amidohydrolase family protein [Solimonas sp.]